MSGFGKSGHIYYHYYIIIMAKSQSQTQEKQLLHTKNHGDQANKYRKTTQKQNYTIAIDFPSIRPSACHLVRDSQTHHSMKDC